MTGFYPQPKPERRSKTKRRVQATRKLSRAQCRQLVFARAKGCCERCGRAVTDDVEPYKDERAHVHEVVPRSLGGDPLSPANCVLWCQKCHTGGGFHRVEGRRQQRG